MILRRLRDRLYTDPRFQRWAARFPPTRRIARRNAQAVFDLTAGFVYSRVLEACIRLEVLERLRYTPETPEVLAEAIDLPVAACERLLVAAAGIELVEPRGHGRFGLGRLGAMVLGNTGLKSMVLHHELLQRDLGDPVALLRGEQKGTEVRSFWTYAGSTDPINGEYSDLMSDSLRMLSSDVLDAHPMSQYQHVLDVGGGDGSFLRFVAERAPNTQLTLFDLPVVAELARERAHGTSIDVVSGDVFSDPLPADADCITLVRVLLDHGDEDAVRILRATRKAIARGGTVVVAEPMRETGADRMTDTYFGMYLWAMGQGRTRTPKAIRQLLVRAGYRNPRSVASQRSLSCHLVTATA